MFEVGSPMVNRVVYAPDSVAQRKSAKYGEPLLYVRVSVAKCQFDSSRTNREYWTYLRMVHVIRTTDGKHKHVDVIYPVWIAGGEYIRLIHAVQI